MTGTSEDRMQEESVIKLEREAASARSDHEGFIGFTQRTPDQ